MSIPLTEEQQMVRAMVREFARKEIEPIAAENDSEGRFPADIIKKMGELGLMGMMVPEKYGGAGASAVSYALAVQEIAYSCASTAVTMSCNNLTCEPILNHGSELLKRKYLVPLASGRKLGAICITEPDAGSDVGAIRTSAKLKGGEYIINGSKMFITNGGFSDIFVVFVRTREHKNKGLSALVVERGMPGFTIGRPEKKMGICASNTVPLTFEGCRVPAENLIGEEGQGFLIVMEALDRGRLGIASQAVGIARAALDEAVRYSKERKAFGRPIASHQAIRWMIADALKDIEAAHLLTLSACISCDRGEPFTHEASIAKLFASETAIRVTYDALQIHGGYGYIKEYKVERLYRDARITTIYEGSSEVQRLVISNHVLK